MDLVAQAQRIGFRKGMEGRNRAWFGLVVSAWGLRTLLKMAERKPEIVAIEALRPGDRIIITHGDPREEVSEARHGARAGSRRARRAQRRVSGRSRRS